MKQKSMEKMEVTNTGTAATTIKLCLFLAVQARAFAPPPTSSRSAPLSSVLQPSVKTIATSLDNDMQSPIRRRSSVDSVTAVSLSVSPSSTALYGIRNFFRKRFGQRGEIAGDDVFLFGLDDEIGNATTPLMDSDDEDSFNDGLTNDNELSPLLDAPTTANEDYITPGPRIVSKSSIDTSSTLTTSSMSSAASKSPVVMGAVKPPTSTFLVQASEVLWSSMAAAAERTSSPPPNLGVRSSKLRLKRWLPEDFDEPIAPQFVSTKTTKNDRRRGGIGRFRTVNPKYSSQYRDMLNELSSYTKRDVSHIPNPRLRALFEGLLASFNDPEILRAFEILYEDYAPFRYAGRLIYKKLKTAITESQIQRENDISNVQTLTGWTQDDIDASRIAFLRMAVYDDDQDHVDDEGSVGSINRVKLGQAKFTLQQLIDYDLAETVVEMLGYDYFESFMQDLLYDDDELQELDEWLELNIDPKKKGKFKFAFSELMVALQNCPLDSIEPECDPATILPEIYTRLYLESVNDNNDGTDTSTTPTTDVSSNTKDLNFSTKQKMYADRYNDMVKDFLKWKDRVAIDKQGRKMDVLRGCFAGADKEEIVTALRIVYVDYKPLRFAGDLIFKIMRAVVMSGIA